MKIKNKSIFLLLISIITSAFAQGLTIIAIPWYFTEINQNTVFSISYGIITCLGLFWGLYAGVLIDYFNRKKILIYINLVNGFIFGIIGLISLLFDLNTLLLFLIGFGFCSFYYTIFFPTLYAISQELADKTEYATVNSLIELLMQITNICAALTCGLLLTKNTHILNILSGIKKWEISEIFILNSGLYFSTYIMLLYVKYPPTKTQALPVILNTFKGIQDAFIFLTKNTRIFIYGICSQIIFAFLIVELFTLLPLFVKNCLNKGIIVFALADVVYGLGAIIASFISVYILKQVDKITYTVLLIIVTGYAVLLMINTQTLYIFYISTLLIGISNASVRITRMTYFFEKIPSFLMGRVNIIFNTINTLIRTILILVFSMHWFTENNHVIIGYKISIYVLCLFCIPLIGLWLKKNQLQIDGFSDTIKK